MRTAVRHSFVLTSLVLTSLVVALGLSACGDGHHDERSASAVHSAFSNGNLLSGTNEPSPTQGVDGDYFLSTTTGRLYGPKTAGAWPAASVSLADPAGETGATGAAGLAGATGATGAAGALGATGSAGTVGATGAAGATGPAGATGATGATGTNGSTLLSGITDPVAATGVNGDFYLNSATSTLYGPKTAGAWPVGVPLTGGKVEAATCTTGATTNIVITSTATRWVFCNFNGGATTGPTTFVNQTLPSAGSYPEGAVVTFQVTAGGGAPLNAGNFTFTSVGSTFNAGGATNVSVSTAYAQNPGVSTQNSSFRIVSDGVSKWYRVLQFPLRELRAHLQPRNSINPAVS